MSRYRTGEPLVFGLATLLVLVHALDDAFVHPGAGLGLGQHALAGAIALAASIGAPARVPVAAPGLRAALAFSFGGLAIVNGALAPDPHREVRRGWRATSPARSPSPGASCSWGWRSRSRGATAAPDPGPGSAAPWPCRRS